MSLPFRHGDPLAAVVFVNPAMCSKKAALPVFTLPNLVAAVSATKSGNSSGDVVLCPTPTALDHFNQFG